MTANMIEVKTAELDSIALDWAVALALGWKMMRVPADIDGQNGGEVLAQPDFSRDFQFPPRGAVSVKFFLRRWSSDWAHGGPLLVKHNIDISPPTTRVHRHGGPLHGWGESGVWTSCTWTPGVSGKRAFAWHETEPLIAAMRCLVLHQIGDTVQVPAELMKGGAG